MSALLYFLSACDGAIKVKAAVIRSKLAILEPLFGILIADYFLAQAQWALIPSVLARRFSSSSRLSLVGDLCPAHRHGLDFAI